MIKYGYHGNDGIIALLEESVERERYETYANQCLWSIAAGLYSIGGQDLSIPQYVELLDPELANGKLTASQIKENVLKRLLEG